MIVLSTTSHIIIRIVVVITIIMIVLFVSGRLTQYMHMVGTMITMTISITIILLVRPSIITTLSSTIYISTILVSRTTIVVIIMLAYHITIKVMKVAISNIPSTIGTCISIIINRIVTILLVGRYMMRILRITVRIRTTIILTI